MDDTMSGLTANDMVLVGRLAAYAEARLSPDVATSTRLRARVLAVAHREATLRRADAGLAVVSSMGGAAEPSGRRAIPAADRRSRPRTVRRMAPAVAAATLLVALVAGSAFAAQAGGPLYATRLWAEELVLPAEPSTRAVAELGRLERRIEEAAEASGRGDDAAVAAALTAYGSILASASARAIDAGDEVAIAALGAGVGHNIAVLRALAERLPDRTSIAIDAAIERAISRSDSAIDQFDRGRTDAGGGGSSGSGGANGGGSGGANGGGSGSGGANGGGAGEPPATPGTPGSTTAPDPKPTRSLKPDVVEQPADPVKPDPTPPAGGKPTGPPAGTGGGPGTGDGSNGD